MQLQINSGNSSLVTSTEAQCRLVISGCIQQKKSLTAYTSKQVWMSCNEVPNRKWGSKAFPIKKKTFHLLGDLRYVEAVVDVVLAGWHGDREQKTFLTSFFTFFFERFAEFLYAKGANSKINNRDNLRR